jgi:hypothetical protein
MNPPIYSAQTCRHLAFRNLVVCPVPPGKPVRCLDCDAEFASVAELEAERAARPLIGGTPAGTDRKEET